MKKEAKLLRKIHYEIIGEGYPLIFLHGNQEDSTIFVKQIEYFKDRYQIILIDTIMHGQSNNSFQKYDFFALAHDVLNIMATEKIEKANFIGYSDGANILFHIAILNDTVINKGVAISGNIHYRGLKRKLRNEICKDTRRYFKIGSDKYYLLYLMHRQPTLKFKDLHKITSDLLIIAGSDDVIKTRHTIKISKNIQNAKLKIVDGFNHYAVVEKPDETNEIIVDYFNN